MYQRHKRGRFSRNCKFLPVFISPAISKIPSCFRDFFCYGPTPQKNTKGCPVNGDVDGLNGAPSFITSLLAGLAIHLIWISIRGIVGIWKRDHQCLRHKLHVGEAICMASTAHPRLTRLLVIYLSEQRYPFVLPYLFLSSCFPLLCGWVRGILEPWRTTSLQVSVRMHYILR